MPNILSISVRDAAGRAGSLPVYFDTGATLTQIQAYATAMLPLLDATIDAKIEGATVQLGITLPSGLKTDAVDNNRVREGANYTFDADSVPYVHTYYVPSVSNEGFAGDTALNTGDYATLISALHGAAGVSSGIQPTDKYGNVLTSYEGGVRAFRK